MQNTAEETTTSPLYSLLKTKTHTISLRFAVSSSIDAMTLSMLGGQQPPDDENGDSTIISLNLKATKNRQSNTALILLMEVISSTAVPPSPRLKDGVLRWGWCFHPSSLRR